MQDRWAEGPDIGTPPRHQPTSTDHMIDVLKRLREVVSYAYKHGGLDYGWDLARIMDDADAILKTYGR